MQPGDIKLRGDRSSIPSGVFVGRLSSGNGPLELISFAQAQAKGLVPSGFRPIGPAGGDLGGKYPNPLVEGIIGIPIVGIPASGQVLEYDAGSGTLVWANLPAVTGYGSFLIDSSGNYYVAVVVSVANPSLVVDSAGIPVYLKNPAFTPNDPLLKRKMLARVFFGF